MTAAIGQGFSQIAAGSACGGAAGTRDTGSGDATSFGDLVHEDGKRSARAASPHAGESKTGSTVAGRNRDRADPQGAEPPLDGQAPGKTRHPHKAGGDDPAGNEKDDDRRPEVAGTGDAQPLRDRLPLLARLNELRHHDTGTPAEADRKPEDAAATKPGNRSHARQPDGAALKIMPGDPAADTIASATKGEQAPKAVAAAASAAGALNRQAENGASPSAAAGKPSSSRDMAARMAGMVSTAAMPAGSGDGTSPDGQQGADASRAGAAGAGRWAAARDDSPQEPERVSKSGAERRPSGSVNVVADPSFAAPAVHPLSRTTAGVVDALAAMSRQAPASALSQPPQAATVAHPAHVLRIELHPVELGMVTASLRMSGEQLSIELKPETAEAYRHLANDSDTIVKSLRKLGLDVDAVTVVQPSIAVQPVARADTGSQAPALAGRDAGQFQPGTSGGGDGFGGQQSGRNRSHDGQAIDRPAPAHRERARGSLFI